MVLSKDMTEDPVCQEGVERELRRKEDGGGEKGEEERRRETRKDDRWVWI